MENFKSYMRKREHAETTADYDNSSNDREATRQKMAQLAKAICHKHPKLMMTLFDKVAQQDSEIGAALDDLKKNMKGSSLGSDQGLGDMKNPNSNEVLPNAADSIGGQDNES